MSPTRGKRAGSESRLLRAHMATEMTQHRVENVVRLDGALLAALLFSWNRACLLDLFFFLGKLWSAFSLLLDCPFYYIIFHLIQVINFLVYVCLLVRFLKLPCRFASLWYGCFEFPCIGVLSSVPGRYLNIFSFRVPSLDSV